MCLIIEEGTKPSVAENDLKVVKILTLFRESCIYDGVCQRYALNELCTTEIQESNFSNRKYFGFKVRDYWGRKLNISVFDVIYSKKLKFIGQGFHSLSWQYRELKTRETYDRVLYNAIIPKGALYYQCPLGTIVSNQIIVLDRLTSEQYESIK